MGQLSHSAGGQSSLVVPFQRVSVAFQGGGVGGQVVELVLSNGSKASTQVYAHRTGRAVFCFPAKPGRSILGL